MKRCPTCQEEFADKFGFCPVDGTPLSNGYNPAAAESVSTSAQPERKEGAAYATANETTAAGESTWASDAAREETYDATEAAAAAGVGSGYGAGYGREEFHLTILEDKGLMRRLTTE